MQRFFDNSRIKLKFHERLAEEEKKSSAEYNDKCESKIPFLDKLITGKIFPTVICGWYAIQIQILWFRNFYEIFFLNVRVNHSALDDNSQFFGNPKLFFFSPYTKSRAHDGNKLFPLAGLLRLARA